MDFENIYTTLISGYMNNGVLDFNLDVLFHPDEMILNNIVWSNNGLQSTNWIFRSTLPTKYNSDLCGISNITSSYSLRIIKEIHGPICGAYKLFVYSVDNLGNESNANCNGWVYISVTFKEYKKKIERLIIDRYSKVYLINSNGINNIFDVYFYVPFNCDKMILRNYVYYNGGVSNTQAIVSTNLPLKYTDKLIALTNQSVNYAFKAEYELSNPNISGIYRFIFTNVNAGPSIMNGFLYLHLEFCKYNKNLK